MKRIISTYPAANYRLKLNNLMLEQGGEIYSKLTIKTPEASVVLVSLLLTLSR